MAKRNSEKARRKRLCQDQQDRRRTSNQNCPMDQQVGNKNTDILKAKNFSRKLSKSKANHIISNSLFFCFLIMAVSQFALLIGQIRELKISTDNIEKIKLISMDLYFFVSVTSGIFAFLAITSGLTYSAIRAFKKAKRQA